MATTTPDPFTVAADIFDPPPSPAATDITECAGDVAVFVQRHCTIEDPDGTVQPFTLWPFQHEPLEQLQDGESVIVLKARRLGLSWVVLAFALWRAVFSQGIRILILCKTEGDASESLDRIRRMLERISQNPDSRHILQGLQRPAKERDAVTKLDVGASTIRALVGTPAAARSETAGLVIADEFAFQRRSSEIWRALLPTIEGGGQIAVISTGNGQTGDGEMFHRLWSIAGQGQGAMHPMFFNWRQRPDRDEAWKQAAIEAHGDEDSFRVEYPEVEEDAFLSVDADFVYPGTHIDAAVKLGTYYDEHPDHVPAPEDAELNLGIDWGEHSHGLVLHPLAGGGIYVRAEVPLASVEPTISSERMLAALAREVAKLDDCTAGTADYDAAGVQPMRTFKATRDRTAGMIDLRTWAVAFGKRKDETLGYLRRLFKRTFDGKTMGTIAISPSCVVLISQLRDLQFSNEDQGKVRKQNDHGPDALIAGAAKQAARHRALLDEQTT